MIANQQSKQLHPIMGLKLFHGVFILAMAMAMVFALSIAGARAHDSPPQQLMALDGDSFEMDGVRYRLWGMDAPPAQSEAGLKSTAIFAAFLKGKTIICDWSGELSLGRLVARCFANGVDLAEWMIKEGQAQPFCSPAGEFYHYAVRPENKGKCTPAR